MFQVAVRIFFARRVKSVIFEERRLYRRGYLNLSGNRIVDISARVDNGGIGTFDTVVLSGNPLNDQALSSHISALEARRVTVMVRELGR